MVFEMKSDKRINHIVSRMQPVQITLGKQAEHLATDVRKNIAPHSNTGAFEESIHVGRGKVDWFVYSDDPLAGYKDYPHVDEEGNLVGGVGAFRKALAEAPAKGLRGVSV